MGVAIVNAVLEVDEGCVRSSNSWDEPGVALQTSHLEQGLTSFADGGRLRGPDSMVECGSPLQTTVAIWNQSPRLLPMVANCMNPTLWLSPEWSSGLASWNQDLRLLPFVAGYWNLEMRQL